MTEDPFDHSLALEEEDRLPWLEAVDSDEKPGIAPGKLLGLAGAGALALLVLGGGYYMLKGQNDGGGDSSIISAPDDAYKAKPDDQGGMKVEGQGDASYAASQGAEANGKVDAGATPEAPVTGTKAPAVAAAPPVAAGSTATAPVVGAKPVASANPNAGAAQVQPSPAAATPAPAAQAGTGLVQLGAYNDAASANEDYNELVSHHGVLKGLNKMVVPAAVNGKTMYRLRVSAGGNAADVCAKVKAGGGNCMVVK